MEISDEERKQFAEDNINLIYHVIHKNFRNRTNDQFQFEDFTSIGMIGLLKAIDSFKPEYGNKFSTYAVPMIWGEISRELRDKESMLKIPRAMKDLQYQAFKGKLLDSTAKEVAEKLEISEEKASEVLRLKKITNVDSLDRKIGEEGDANLYTKVGGYQQDFETGLMIEDINKMLKPQEQEVMRLTMSGKTQEETASIVRVSQAQISRILLKIKLKVKKYMEGDTTMANENTELAKRLVAEGKMSVNDIAKETGLTYQTIDYHKKRFENAAKENQPEPVVGKLVPSVLVPSLTLTPVQNTNNCLIGFDFNISGGGQVPVKEFVDKLQSLIQIISNSGVISVNYNVSVCNIKAE